MRTSQYLTKKISLTNQIIVCFGVFFCGFDIQGIGVEVKVGEDAAS